MFYLPVLIEFPAFAVVFAQTVPFTIRPFVGVYVPDIAIVQRTVIWFIVLTGDTHFRHSFQHLHHLQPFPSRLCMVLCVIPQMTRRTHGHQVLRPHILRRVVQVGHRQRSFVCVEWFSGLSALNPAPFTPPTCGFLFRRCDSFPIRRIAVTLHRHPTSPPSRTQGRNCTTSLSYFVFCFQHMSIALSHRRSSHLHPQSVLFLPHFSELYT